MSALKRVVGVAESRTHIVAAKIAPVGRIAASSLLKLKHAGGVAIAAAQVMDVVDEAGDAAKMKFEFTPT